MKALSVITYLFLSSVNAIDKDAVAVQAMKDILLNSLITCDYKECPAPYICGQAWIDNWYEVGCMYPEKCDTKTPIPGSDK